MQDGLNSLHPMYIPQLQIEHIELKGIYVRILV